jgi:hypothetical protein
MDIDLQTIASKDVIAGVATVIACANTWDALLLLLQYASHIGRLDGIHLAGNEPHARRISVR